MAGRRRNTTHTRAFQRVDQTALPDIGRTDRPDRDARFEVQIARVVFDQLKDGARADGLRAAYDLLVPLLCLPHRPMVLSEMVALLLRRRLKRQGGKLFPKILEPGPCIRCRDKVNLVQN